MVKVKICGITSLEDALFAAKSGAWAVGFVFAKESPRYIAPEKAAEIIKKLPEKTEKTGVFVDSSLEEITEISQKTGLTTIQLHGNETEEFCGKLSDRLKLPVIKALRIKEADVLLVIPKYKNQVFAILLDSWSSKEFGGTGKTFNWDIAVKAKSYGIPVILAGGLNPDNIREAFLKVQPYALDISTGVEKDKGIKDHNRIKNLFRALK